MITFHAERMETFFRDGQELFPLHYKELALNQDVIPLELDTERYLQAEKDGALAIVTVRDDGKLVGYVVAAILRHLHYASLVCASVDMYWLRPEYRKGYGAKMFMFAMDYWTRRGAKKFYVSCKVQHDHRPMFAALGFTLSDYMLTRLAD